MSDLAVGVLASSQDEVSGCGLIGRCAEGGRAAGAGILRGEDGGGRGSCDMQLLPQAQRGFRLAQNAGRLLICGLASAHLASRPVRLLCLCSCMRPQFVASCPADGSDRAAR